MHGSQRECIINDLKSWSIAFCFRNYYRTNNLNNRMT